MPRFDRVEAVFAFVISGIVGASAALVTAWWVGLLITAVFFAIALAENIHRHRYDRLH